jgi:hypothetical protein
VSTTETAPETWTPKPPRGYSWPPFGPRNTKSLRHGIWSKRTVDPLAQDLVAGLLSERDDLNAYPELLMAWGRAEARCLLLADWFVQRGLFDDEGKERPGLRFVGQFEKLAADLRAQLGLTPGSEADLARSRADAIKGELDLEGLAARGREARLAAEQRHAVEAGPSSPPGGELAGQGSAVPVPGDAGTADGEGEGSPSPPPPHPAA